MSDRYKILKGDAAYFVTFTITDWIKVLADDSYKMIVVDSIRYCQMHKGLMVYGYCIMPNHVHMIMQATGERSVSDILRDLKTFTSKAIIRKLESEKPAGYDIILARFKEAGQQLKRIERYKVWKDGNHAECLYSNGFIKQKLNYIHNNPVKAGLCSEPWEYIFSSATNYSENDSLLEVCLLSV